MSREGWIAIRNFPLPETSSLRNASASHKTLRNFFKRHRTCPKCDGYGFLIDRELERSNVEAVKFDGIRALERLKQKEGIIFGDVIKEIFLHEYAGKRPCPKCKGFRFVERVAD